MPAEVEVPSAGGGFAREEAVDDSGHLHHAVVLAQVVLGLGQERVLPPVAAYQRYLHAARTPLDTLSMVKIGEFKEIQKTPSVLLAQSRIAGRAGTQQAAKGRPRPLASAAEIGGEPC